MTDDTEFFKIGKIADLNLDLIVSQLPGAPLWRSILSQTQGRYVKAFLESEDILEQHGLNSALRLAHFLGQGLIETGFLRYTAENLNYSAAGLRSVFGKYFTTDEDAAKYARQPEKIANRVYGNRMGNGDEASGDGWKYRGRGFIQLTGKNNYTRFALLTGLPIDTDPDLLSRDLKASIQVAAKFFEVNDLLKYADKNDAKAVSRGINFGNPNISKPAHGEADRLWWTEKALDLFRKEDKDVVSPRGGGVLKIGSKGHVVEEFQRLLVSLDYAVGGIDGDYGPATKNMVVAFQEQAGLPVTGEIDQMTALAIDAAVEAPVNGSNRASATEDDLRARGDETPDDTNQIGAGGAVIVIATGIAAASEILGGDDNSEGEALPVPTPTATPEPVPVPTETPTPEAEATATPLPDASDTPVITPTPGPEITSTSVPAPAPVPASAGKDGGPNWVLIGALVVIVVAAIWMFTRAGKIKKAQVQKLRDGKIV